jgi:hypothetical protein
MMTMQHALAGGAPEPLTSPLTDAHCLQQPYRQLINSMCSVVACPTFNALFQQNFSAQRFTISA